MLTLPNMLALSVVVFLLTYVAVKRILHYLREKAVYDHPNERSSHTIPTPRGGGLAVTAGIVLGWASVWALGWLGKAYPLQLGAVTRADGLVLSGNGLWGVLLCGIGLGIISWMDDRKSLPALPRLGAQLLAASIGVFMLPGDGLVFQGLFPPVLDMAATVFLWVWFINLYNFMDGIDGITSVETLSIGFGGAAILHLAQKTAPDMTGYALVLGATSLAFYLWNRHPAKLFLGDVGSVPMGFFTGWFLLSLAAHGLWETALLLPMYYLVDSTWTLLSRLMRRENILKPHREHAYQIAVVKTGSPPLVVWTLFKNNLFLCLLGFIASWTQEQKGGLALFGFLLAIRLCMLFRGMTENEPSFKDGIKKTMAGLGIGREKGDKSSSHRK